MNNRKRTVIVCESYPSIAYTLYRLEEEEEDGEVPVTIFFPTLKDLFALFQVINERIFNNRINLIFFPQYSQKWASIKGIKRLIYILPDIIRERRYLSSFYNTNFGDLKDADVLFSSPGYSGAKIYILQRLSIENSLVYIDPGPVYMGEYTPRSLSDLALLITYKLIYGKATKIGQFPPDDPWSKGFPLLPDKFMKNSVNSTVDWSNRDRIMMDFPWEKYRVFNTGKYKVIYFHQDLVNRDVPDRDTFVKELTDIFNIVLRYYPEKKIARKYHPAHELNKDVIKVGEELPVYIPAEMLYNEKVDLYLGISSNSIIGVRNGRAVSLINLISFKSNELKEQQKEWMIKASRSEILFPSSLEELGEIVSRISEGII